MKIETTETRVKSSLRLAVTRGIQVFLWIGIILSSQSGFGGWIVWSAVFVYMLTYLYEFFLEKEQYKDVFLNYSEGVLGYRRDDVQIWSEVDLGKVVRILHSKKYIVFEGEYPLSVEVFFPLKHQEKIRELISELQGDFPDIEYEEISSDFFDLRVNG